VWSDIRAFFLHRPTIPTCIDLSDPTNREDYAVRISQRIGVDPTEYAVLNVHRIGIDAPLRVVFEEILRWDGKSLCWPGHLAAARRVDGRMEDVEILLLGRRRFPLGIGAGRLGVTFIPLFRMHATKIQKEPDPALDNARYMLFQCTGGYPIGFFSMYVRSPIAGLGERKQAQLFFGVGFDFYGRKDWPTWSPLNPIWEAVHNRATANIMNRFKQLCEWRQHELERS
jgi:hypothetical protein